MTNKSVPIPCLWPSFKGHTKSNLFSKVNRMGGSVNSRFKAFGVNVAYMPKAKIIKSSEVRNVYQLPRSLYV
jgi:hypothetical protein